MFAHRSGLIKGLVTLVCAFALIAFSGCGGDDPPTSGDAALGAESASTDSADADDLEVIEGWSSALSEGDVEAAAAYFATPSTAENGVVVEIESIEDAVRFNESLPCGAEVTAAETDGDLTIATFLLSERPGGGCGSGSGGEASTSFRIEDGKIVEWRRVAPADAPPGPGPGSPV